MVISHVRTAGQDLLARARDRANPVFADGESGEEAGDLS